jgi:histidyl-tRNA synthetase
MEKQTYTITFEGVSASDANRYAEELRNALLNATADITVQRKRENSQAQDFGSTLVLILGTPAVAAVVTALNNWLQLRKNASLSWKSADGEIYIRNISSKNVVELAQQLLNKQQGGGPGESSS